MKVLKTFSYLELDEMHLSLLREIGRYLGVKSPTAIKKEELISSIMKIQSGEAQPFLSNKGAPPKLHYDLSKFLVESVPESEPYPTMDEDFRKISFKDIESESSQDGFLVEGVLEILDKGYGFIRNGYSGSEVKDVYVSRENIKRYNLIDGDKIRAYAKQRKEADSPALTKILLLNDEDPAVFWGQTSFDDLTPCYPDEKIVLENPECRDLLNRCIDLFCPIGFGQRGLIVAPPKTGKTTIMKNIAKAIEFNYPDVKVFILLIDERPEEVTDFKSSVKSEVVSSTFDENPANHVKAADGVLSRAKRLVEAGKNVVILVDSITKLTRAMNTQIEPSGRTLSGGLDVYASAFPKKFFGSARNIKGGGSLTIISTALVETGSRMDDLIYEEFKGTGNMEIQLSRNLAEKRIFPAIDIYKSGTRKEELLLSEKEMNVAYKIRRMLYETPNSTEVLFDMMKKAETNEEFIEKAEGWLKMMKK